MTNITNLNKIDIRVSLSLNSFNYIACIWEPTIENTNIKLQFLKNDKTSFIIEDNELLINLSDMNISFVLGSLNNWIKKFIDEKKNYEFFISSPSNFRRIKNNESKISNNEVFNHTGENLKIKYAGQNFDLNKQESITLEYIKDWNEEFYGKKEIIIVYNNIFNFNIPIEKLGTIKHSINNDDFFISENTLSKDRHINISIYSPIIFRNITSYDITIVFLSNQHFCYVLNPGKKIGVPFNLINSKVSFYFLPGVHLNPQINNTYNISIFGFSEIKEIKIGQHYKKGIFLEHQYLNLNLNRDIPNVRELVIMSEFSIVNCLPINIDLNISGKYYKIKKCNQFYLDFTREKNFAFQISAYGHIFNSNFDYWFDRDNDNYIKFIDNNGFFFYISKIKVYHSNGIQLIIYAENLINNKS